MVECTKPALPILQQCRLLVLPRSSVYRKPAGVSAEDLAILALIDRHYLARPYYGSRRMAAWLATQGHHVNRKRVQRLMRLLGLAAIYQRPNTSKPAAAHKIYPYLLRGLTIERINQVWCSDITYIPMAKGFVYLVVIMDWVSRAVLAWRASNTLDADFCVEFSWYAANFGNFNKTYGSLGAIIGFMTWMWLSIIVVLMGAKLNAELEHQTTRAAEMADTSGPS